MYPTSARFRRAVTQSHTAVSKVEVIRGSSVTTFQPLEGNVVYDFDDTTRRSLDCTLIDSTGRTFTQMESLIDPYIATLRPWRGIQFDQAGLDIEWVPLGYFYTDGLEVFESDGAVLWRIAALDQSSMAMKPLENPVFIPNGTKIWQAIPQVLSIVQPQMSFALSQTLHVTPNVLLNEDSNPWDETVKLANASGNDLYLSRSDVCVLGARPYSVTHDPVDKTLEFVEGENATFWDPKRQVSTRPPNVVVVVGTNTQAPGIRVEVGDMDPYSPTFVGGPYGRVVKIIRSELAITIDIARAMGGNALSKLLGPQDEMTFSCIVNPAIDESDTIAMTRARLGMNRERRLVSHIEIPLSVDAEMQVTGRRNVLTDGRAA